MTNPDMLTTDAERQPVLSVKNGEVFADSRDVAAVFGKEHRDVLRAIDNLIKEEPDLGLRTFAHGYYELQNTGPQKHRMCDMSRDGFTLLAMGFTGSKALKWKLRYIEAFNAMEAELRGRAPVDPMQMLNDPIAMRGLLLTYSEKVLTLEADKAAMQPKVEALDRIAESEGSFCVTDAAKTLQITRNVLFKWLRTSGWIYRRVGTNYDVAYQSRIASGCLIHKVEPYVRSDGTDGTRTQVRVTTKGLTVLAIAFPLAVRAA